MKKYEKSSVIYKITNLINNKIYVGSAVNFRYRVKNHLHMLRNNKHHSIKLQNSWNKHGEINFIFDIIEICEKNNLISREQHYLDLLTPFYNICKTAYSSIGREVSEETREKLRKSSSGRIVTEETRRKISESHKGMIVSEKTREKLRNISLGKKQSEETIRKRVLKNTGQKRSEETKIKMSNSHKGKKMSSEAIEKTRQSNLGRIPWNKGKKKLTKTNEIIKDDTFSVTAN